ncbi:MAG: hypothetical protein ACFE9R_11615 [Candidatus Hermodarchaeota archaeon]
MKIEISRQGNFILACLFIHFLFFGYICNIYDKAIGENVLFLYKVMFHPASFLSTIILFVIVFIMVYREEFTEFGIKNSLWLVVLIIIESWIWYFFIRGFDGEVLIQTFINIFPLYFIRYETYLTILILLGINLATAFFAGFVKTKLREYRKKLMKKPTMI